VFAAVVVVVDAKLFIAGDGVDASVVESAPPNFGNAELCKEALAPLGSTVMLSGERGGVDKAGDELPAEASSSTSTAATPSGCIVREQQLYNIQHSGRTGKKTQARCLVQQAVQTCVRPVLCWNVAWKAFERGQVS